MSCFTAVAATGPSGSSAASEPITSGPSSGRAVDAAVRALHQRGVERDHVHQGAKAEGALREPRADRELRTTDRRIEEQLDRIVAGLAMDLDRAGEVRRAGVVEPVVVGEPGVRLRERDELARARDDRGRAPACRPRRAPRRRPARFAEELLHRRRSGPGRRRRRARSGGRRPRRRARRPGRASRPRPPRAPPGGRRRAARG